MGILPFTNLPVRMAQVDVVNVEGTEPDVVPNENQACIDLAALKDKKQGVIRKTTGKKGDVWLFGPFFLGGVFMYFFNLQENSNRPDMNIPQVPQSPRMTGFHS